MADTVYDVVIIGSGPAGYTAAIRAGQYGLKTALIEKDSKLGGTCLHVGCIPTKALLYSATIFDHIKNASEYGITNVGDFRVDWPAVMQRKDKIVTKHAKGLEFLMRKNKVETINGTGRLSGPAKDGLHSVVISGGKAGNKTIQAKNVILATGSEARMLPGLQADDRILTNIEILSLKEIPKSLVIVGSGAVGVEFASIYKTFGSEVTILEMLPRMVPVEDEEVSKELQRVYKKRGINFHVNAKVEKVERTDSGIAVDFTVDGKSSRVEAERVLIAVGRRPRTETTGIENVPNVKTERGFVHVGPYMETGEPGVYAIGDIVAGFPQLAHAGAAEGLVAVARIAGKSTKAVNPTHIPGATYCEPQIGSVGLTEAKAKELGYKVKIGKFPFTANSKATILGAHEGFIKVVADETYGEILGVHIIGAEATELIAESVAVLELEGTVEDLMATIHPHPTVSEAMSDADNSVYGLAINA